MEVKSSECSKVATDLDDDDCFNVQRMNENARKIRQRDGCFCCCYYYSDNYVINSIFLLKLHVQ